MLCFFSICFHSRSLKTKYKREHGIGLKYTFTQNNYLMGKLHILLNLSQLQRFLGPPSCTTKQCTVHLFSTLVCPEELLLRSHAPLCEPCPPPSFPASSSLRVHISDSRGQRRRVFKSSVRPIFQSVVSSKHPQWVSDSRMNALRSKVKAAVTQ